MIRYGRSSSLPKCKNTMFVEHRFFHTQVQNIHVGIKK